MVPIVHVWIENNMKCCAETTQSSLILFARKCMRSDYFSENKYVTCWTLGLVFTSPNKKKTKFFHIVMQPRCGHSFLDFTKVDQGNQKEETYWLISQQTWGNMPVITYLQMNTLNCKHMIQKLSTCTAGKCSIRCAPLFYGKSGQRLYLLLMTGPTFILVQLTLRIWTPTAQVGVPFQKLVPLRSLEVSSIQGPQGEASQ